MWLKVGRTKGREEDLREWKTRHMKQGRQPARALSTAAPVDSEDQQDMEGVEGVSRGRAGTNCRNLIAGDVVCDYFTSCPGAEGSEREAAVQRSEETCSVEREACECGWDEG